MMGCQPGMALMTFEQCERAIVMLTAGMSAQINNKSTTEQISANWKRHRLTQIMRKTMLWEDHFLTISPRCNRFLSGRMLGRLLRNATGVRVCDRTVWNRHIAQLKACRSYVGIPLM